jgi:hypothetical protein
MKKARLNKKDFEQYDWDFCQACEDNNLKVVADEDGWPIVQKKRRYGKRNILYKLSSFGPDLIDITILDIPISTKRRMLHKLNHAGIEYRVHVEATEEIIIIFNLKDLRKIKRIFNLRKRTSKYKITEEHLEKLLASRKNRKANKNLIPENNL